MNLPNELIDQICAFLDLDSLIALCHTDKRLREIAQPRFELTVRDNWPWVKTWSKEAFHIRRERLRLKNDGGSARLSYRAVPDTHIHTSTAVPSDVTLLSDTFLWLGINMIDLRDSTLVSAMSYMLPEAEIDHFRRMYGEKDALGRTIVTYVTNRKAWGFALEQGDTIEETVNISEGGDWFFGFYRTDDSYIAVKHRCCENGLYISDKPNYLMTLPPSKFGEHYELSAILTPQQTFVIDHPLEGYSEDFGPSFLRLLDFEAGITVDVCEIPDFLNMGIVDLWLDGPTLYIWAAIDEEELLMLDTLEGWIVKLKRESDERDISFYDECSVRGFTHRGKRVIDLRKRVIYEVSYNGACLTAGLIEGEVHWWLFPKAEELLKERRHVAIKKEISIL